MDNNIKVTEQEIHDDERIDAFLRGKMSDDEAQQFLKELESNQELKGKAIAMARLAKAMNKVGREREEETVKMLQSVSKKEFMEVISENTSIYPSADYALVECTEVHGISDDSEIFSIIPTSTPTTIEASTYSMAAFDDDNYEKSIKDIDRTSKGGIFLLLIAVFIFASILIYLIIIFVRLI